MRLSDTIQIRLSRSSYDENGDFVLDSEISLPLGKCIILPNGKAAEKGYEDGKAFENSYEVFLKIPPKIPEEGEIVHICKKDGSIDTDCIIKGRVTLKHWLKLWLTET